MNFAPIRAFFSSYRVTVASCNLCASLVAVLVSELWAMAGKDGTVFDNWPLS